MAIYTIQFDMRNISLDYMGTTFGGLMYLSTQLRATPTSGAIRTLNSRLPYSTSPANEAPDVDEIRLYNYGSPAEWNGAYTKSQWYTVKMEIETTGTEWLFRSFLEGTEKLSGSLSIAGDPTALEARINFWNTHTADSGEFQGEVDNFSYWLNGNLLITDDFGDGDLSLWPRTVVSGTPPTEGESGGVYTINDTGFDSGEFYRAYTLPILGGRNHHLCRDWKTNRIFKVYAR